MHQPPNRFSSAEMHGRIDSRAALIAAAHRAREAVGELRAIEASERAIELVTVVEGDLKAMLDSIEQGSGKHADSR